MNSIPIRINSSDIFLRTIYYISIHKNQMEKNILLYIFVQIIQIFFSSSHFVYLLFLPKYIKSVKTYINSNPKRWWVNMSPNTPTMRDVGKNIFFPYRISSRLYGRCNICISFHKNYVFVVLKIHIYCGDTNLYFS